MNYNENREFPKIRLGLCCQNITLKLEQQIYSSRKRILSVIKKKGIESLKELAISNVIDLAKMITWNKNHGIDVVRISSELVPHNTNDEIVNYFGQEGKKYSEMDFLRKYLEPVGEIAIKEKMRLTFHCPQFIQIGTPNEIVFEKSVLELEMHRKFIDFMKLDQNSVIVVHLGGTYNNKYETLERFKRRFMLLPTNIKNRLVFENDEKCYDAEEVLEVCKILNVPMVLDIFHYYCYKLYHPDAIQKDLDELLPEILNTWKKRNIRPKFHVSQQAKNGKIGAHSLFVNEIPDVLLNIPQKYKTNIDIMIEAKAKEFAISKLYDIYPYLKPKFRLELPKNIPLKALKALKNQENYCLETSTKEPKKCIKLNSDCGCECECNCKN